MTNKVGIDPAPLIAVPITPDEGEDLANATRVCEGISSREWLFYWITPHFDQ